MTNDPRSTGRGAGIQIVLATYQGARWLPEQLASLEAQRGPGWTLLARDDGSRDDSGALLSAFAKKHPGRVEVDVGHPGNLGARDCFGRLLEHTRAPYVMLCDQDDVWLPDKVEVALEAMRAAEARAGAATPVLVFTDARVVGPDLAELAPSLWRAQGSDPWAVSLARLLVQNTVTGCTAMANRALVEAACPVPPEALMHDWWLALVAAALGRVVPVDRATLLYRQHPDNHLGARAHGAAAVLSWPRRRAELAAVMAAQLRQGQALLARLGPRMAREKVRLLEDFAALGDAGWARRRWIRARHGLWYSGLARNVALAIFG